MKHKVFEIQGFKALSDEPEGTFEAIVAVFNNIDRYGDKIIPGAFADSLAEWQAKGRPIPVIFSHEWNNLDAHIGEVLEAKEVERGLFVKAKLELDEPFAARVWKKMKSGTLAEFSFAYDIVDAAWVSEKQDGRSIEFYELRKLELMEVGPCLVGVNPETELISVKDLTAIAAREAGGLQSLHDLIVSLGAKCSHGGDSDGEDEGHGEDEAGDGKSSTHPSVIAARMDVELLELDDMEES